MNTSKILSMAAGLMLLSACNSDELDEFAGRIPINLGYETLTVEEATRTAVTTDLNDANIASGRIVKVRISTNSGSSYTDYDYTTAASGSMTPPSPKPYYPTSGSVKIVAYHPSTASTTFTVESDQTNETNYHNSDLMFSNNITAQEKTTSTVNLQFTHKMAKLVVTANKGDGVNGIKTITLKQVKRQVSFDQTTGTVGTATTTGSTDVTLFKDGSNTTTSGAGAALIPTQTITGALLEIDTDQGTATYSVASPGKTFNANTKYTVTVTVNRTAVGITNSITWGSEASLTVNPTTTVVQKTPVGLEAVDLGLSSGLKWANMNVGATSETDYGLYFAWGETTGYTSDTSDGRSFNWASYDLGNSSSNLYMYNSTDGLTTLKMSDDAARANWGGNWRMPTETEFQELLDNTTNEWVTDPAPGWKFTSKASGNTNSIFLPAAGYRLNTGVFSRGSYGDYWSSSLGADRPSSAWNLSFGSGAAVMYGSNRCYGYSVRAVQ